MMMSYRLGRNVTETKYIHPEVRDGASLIDFLFEFIKDAMSDGKGHIIFRVHKRLLFLALLLNK